MITSYPDTNYSLITALVSAPGITVCCGCGWLSYVDENDARVVGLSMQNQDLGLELKKRNMTQDAEETKEILEGLDALPGVSASTTVLPSVDLTPREASLRMRDGGELHWCFKVCISMDAEGV